MSGDYRPVACGFHDELTLWVMRRTPCRVRYRGADGAERVTLQRLADVYTREGAEWLRLADGTELRLDRLREVTPEP
jgi:Rho-binding antiterminator